MARPGGSITPRVSPDGKSLAFIRRVDLGSRLFVRDLATGVETSVFDGLDKDLQEAWAVHGVYAQYAWTPDGKGFVIWGKGGLWRVDLAAKTGTQDPVPRQGRADGQRVAALQPRGRARALPGAHAAPREGGARRPQRRVQRSRAPVPARAARWRAASPHAGRGPRGVAHVLARRPVDCVRDVGRRGEGPAEGDWRRRAGRPRRHRHAGPLRGAVVLARWRVDRLPRHRTRHRPRHHLRHRHRRVRRAHRRRHAEEGHRRRPGAALQPRRHAHLPARPPRRSGRAAQRHPRGRRRDRPRPVRERDPDRAVARQQVGGLRGALPHLRDAVPGHGTSGHHRAWRLRVPGGAGLARRRLLAALVGRQPARALGARSRAVHARPDEDVRVRRRRAGRAGAARDGGRQHRLHAGERRPDRRDRPGRRPHHHHGRHRPRTT